MQLPMPIVISDDRDRVTPSDWARILATFPVFEGIAKRRLRELARESTFAEYSPGEIVIQREGRGDSLFVILSGSAKVRGRPAARPLRTGDYFGELGVLDGVPRSATVVATDELHVMRVPRDAFLRLAEHDPAVTLRMMGRLGSQIRRLEALPAQA
jgi:CRP/FNR family transcriptional regulator, cyclic AMP receptor protein